MPGTRVLVLGFYDHAELRRQSLAAGAAAYLVKDLDLTALREALLAPPASAAPQPA
jgi:DNA-binding NarL/FixJ family response regulator